MDAGKISFFLLAARSRRILAGWPPRNSVTASRSSRHQSKNRPIFFARSRSSLALFTPCYSATFHFSADISPSLSAVWLFSIFVRQSLYIKKITHCWMRGSEASDTGLRSYILCLKTGKAILWSLISDSMNDQTLYYTVPENARMP